MSQPDYDALPLRIELRETRVGGWVLITSRLDALMSLSINLKSNRLRNIPC